MIAIVIFVVMAAVLGVMAVMGLAPASFSQVPWPWVAAFALAFVAMFAGGVHVGAALAMLALAAGMVFSDRPFLDFVGQILWSPSSSFVLVAVPLFLLMGEIMLRTGLSERLYRSMNVFLNRLPGGLLHTNIAASAVFSAVSGSSVATAATMGSVALPYFKDSRYPAHTVLGSLAAGGALGNLIPPGITFIIYGLITDTSVGDLYLAAAMPSLLVILLFTAVIVASAWRSGDGAVAHRYTWAEKWAAVVDLLPVLVLVGLVLGTIYGGWATPTESAALGVAGAMAHGLWERRLSWRQTMDCLRATATVTSMIGLILMGAYFLNYILASLGLPQFLAKMLTEVPLPAWALMLMIIGFYLALGTFMEGMSMIITTVPLVFPLVKALGYDPVWFGVIVTMLVEIAMISPPDGTVLYVLQGM
ncbi:MAG TPA: TRAP transporter large permease subunit, partial [Ramlibacter sp.]|nr:TRAP transporter large permease subunit [Ramlibacter sp.]